MDNSHYICFCRKLFADQTAFKAHLPCVDLVNALNKKPKFDKIPSKSNEVHLVQRSLRPKSETVIKIMKVAEIVSDSIPVNEQVPTVTTTVGKRLPSRTKVPFLSRAVPLSTDHSFERCTCGAVFVTRVGKRQHQARFCKLAKNKSHNKITTTNIESLMETMQTVSPSELGHEYVENGNQVINDIYDEQTIIQYEVNETVRCDM